MRRVRVQIPNSAPFFFCVILSAAKGSRRAFRRPSSEAQSGEPRITRSISIRLRPHPHLYFSEERACPELCRRVGAIPIAPGEVQRQHTRDAYSCTESLVVAFFFCVILSLAKDLDGRSDDRRQHRDRLMQR